MNGKQANDTAVRFDAVSFSYSQSSSRILNNISCTIDTGEFVVITGKPGSGKTTFCRCINGIIPHALEGELSGKVTSCGLNTAKVQVQILAQKVGFVMDDSDVQIVGRTVFEDVAFGLRNVLVGLDEIHQRVPRILKMMDLHGFEGRLSHTLSGGEKQRLAMAGILVMNPQVLVLDEALSELDPIGRSKVYTLLRDLQRKNNLTVITVELDPSIVPFLPDAIIQLKDGKVSRKLTVEEYESIRGRSRGEAQEETPYEAYVRPNTHPLVSTGQRPTKGPPTLSERLFLEVDHLHYHCGGTGILNDLSFSAERGEFIGLVGPNGAGKTTLIKHLNALLTPPLGTVLLEGKDLHFEKPETIFHSVGIVLQNPDHQIFNTTVAQELEFGLKNLGMPVKKRRARVTDLIGMLDLEEYRHAHPHTLSRGIRQVLCCASIICMEPKLLLIDEPTTGLDDLLIRMIMGMIVDLNARGTTVLMISHDQKLIKRYTSRRLIMERGCIVTDDSRSIVTATDGFYAD